MALNPAKLLLNHGKTALLICDVQAKFSKVTYEFDKMVSNATKLINVCKVLEVPMIVTEQKPKELGPTVADFDLSSAKGPFAKTQFNMCTPEVNEALSTICNGEKPESVAILGLEAHACIECTAIDLCNRGIQVHAVADCISARNKDDRLLALNRMQQIGCVLATVESVIFHLLRDAENEGFKKIIPLIRPPSMSMGLSSLSA